MKDFARFSNQQSFEISEPVQNDGISGEFWRQAEFLWKQKAYRDAMFIVTRELNAVRSGLATEDWKNYIQKVCRQNSLFQALHRGLIARRSLTKPRGYSGDAVLIDYIYGVYPQVEDELVDPLVYTAEYGASSCASVRERRHLIAEFIDNYHSEKKPRILSVAAGHAREANVSEVLRSRCFEEFVVFDQDALSLQTIESDYRHLRPVCVRGSIGRLALNKYQMGNFDLIYCAGLYDYLSDATAARLTEHLIKSLAPNGQLLIANFTPDLLDKAYLEAIADWFLVYRDETGINKILEMIDVQKKYEMSMFRDSQSNIVYLKVICTGD